MLMRLLSRRTMPNEVAKNNNNANELVKHKNNANEAAKEKNDGKGGR